MDAIVKKLDMASVREHYLARERVHSWLRNLYAGNQVNDFVRLALGISDPLGNYSAAEHGLGPRILAEYK